MGFSLRSPNNIDVGLQRNGAVYYDIRNEWNVFANYDASPASPTNFASINLLIVASSV
jgi:hypothetical protein